MKPPSARQVRTAKSSVFQRLARFLGKLVLGVGILGAIFALIRSSFLTYWQPFPMDQNWVVVVQPLAGQSRAVGVWRLKTNGQVHLEWLPLTASYDLIGGYGQYQLGAVAPLLELEHKSPAFQRAAWSYALGSVIDQVMVVPDQFSGQSHGEGIGPDQVGLAEWQKLLKFGWWARWENTIKGTASAVEVGQLETFLKQRAPGEFTQSQHQSLDAWQAALKTASIHTTAENCQIAVVNSTATRGVARFVSQILEQSQLQVIKSSDVQQRLAASQILLNQKETQFTSRCPRLWASLQALFPWAVTPQLDTATVDQYRSDVVIMIGQDLADVLGERETR